MMVITTSIVKARLYPYKSLVLRLCQFHGASNSSSSYRYFSAAVPPQNKNDDDDEQKFGFVESAKKLIIEKVVTPKNQFYMLGKVPLLHWESDMFRLIIRPYSLKRFHFHFRLYCY